MKIRCHLTFRIQIYLLIVMTISFITSQTKDLSSSLSATQRQVYRQKRSITRDSMSSQESSADTTNIVSAETHRRRHSRRKQASFAKLTRQLNATNTTEPGHATVYMEEGKLPQYECAEDEWACPYPRHQLVTCIPTEKLCDYEVDCPSGEDEDPVQCSFHRAHTKEQEENSAVLLETILQQQRLLETMSARLDQLGCEIESNKQRIHQHRHDHNAVHLDFVDDMCSRNASEEDDSH